MLAYIKLEDALEVCRSYQEDCIGCGDYTDANVAGDIFQNIANLPTSDVAEVKHGEWIIKNNERDWKDKDTYRLYIECSECGKTHFLGTTKYQNEYGKEKLKALGNYADYSFCGKCGAKMDLKPQKC